MFRSNERRTSLEPPDGAARSDVMEGLIMLRNYIELLTDVIFKVYSCLQVPRVLALTTLRSAECLSFLKPRYCRTLKDQGLGGDTAQ
jgi:hypothetical protein